MMIMMITNYLWVRFVSCVGCSRRQHQICVQHVDQICTSGYVCDDCLLLNKQTRAANPYVAESECAYCVIHLWPVAPSSVKDNLTEAKLRCTTASYIQTYG